MVLSSSNSMEEANEFVQDDIFMEVGMSLMAWRMTGVLRMVA